MFNIAPYTKLLGTLALSSALLLSAQPGFAKTTAVLDAMSVKQAIQTSLEDKD